jgi:hypothetical protein
MVDIEFAKELKEDIVRKEKIIYLLYKLLDNIDTASDMFKDDYKGLAKYVYKLQQKRHDVISKAYVNELYDRYHVWEVDKKGTEHMDNIGSEVINKNSGKKGVVLRVTDSGSVCVLESVNPYVLCTHDNWNTLELCEEITAEYKREESTECCSENVPLIAQNKIFEQREKIKRLEEIIAKYEEPTEGCCGKAPEPCGPELTAEDEARYKQELSRGTKVNFIVNYMAVVPEIELDKIVRAWVADKEKSSEQPKQIIPLVLFGGTKEELHRFYCITDKILKMKAEKREIPMSQSELQLIADIKVNLEGYVDPCQR